MKAKITDSRYLNIPENGNLSSNREILTGVLKSWLQKLGYYSMFTALPAILTSVAQDVRAEEAEKSEASFAGHVRFLEGLNKNRSKPELLKGQSMFRLPHQKSSLDIMSVLAGGDNCPGNAIPGGNYTVASPFIDSGNTTGANSTVSGLCLPYYCYAFDDAAGPDQIYTFRITSLGSNPQIQVSATSAAYTPLIYVLDSRFGSTCPAGTDNNAQHWQLLTRSYAPSPGGTASLDSSQLNGLPLNTPLYLFIDSTSSGNFGSYTIRMQDVTINGPAATPRTKFDFDGDGKADVSVFRPSDRTWYLNRSSQGFSATQFGLSTDKITPADFDGDGKTDIAVYREGNWYWLNSSNGSFNARQFGAADDIPVPANFKGDERAELAVYRGGIWYVLNLQNNQTGAVQFGLSTDKPVVGDYDGDGLSDYAVYRDGVWYLLRSGQGFAEIQFGISTDKLVPADYDGDGKTDVAVYRDGVWYLLRWQTGFTAFQFGLAGDIPTPADYDGDGRADASVFRDGNWYVLQSTNGFSATHFGLTSDKPIPSAFLP